MPTKATSPGPLGAGRPPMLSEVMREQMRLRRYARRTEEAYVGWTRKFIRYHRGRHPRELGDVEVRAYLSYLANQRNVAASTQRQVLKRLLAVGFGL